MTTTPRPATPKSGPRRVLMLVVGVLIMVAPGVITSTLWTPEATSPLLPGSIVGAVAAAALGWRLGLLTVFIMGLATPAAIVAGGVPLAGAGLMALLCLFTGLTAFRGDAQRVPDGALVLAYPMIQPPSLGTLGADRASEPYVLAMMLLMTVAAWMVLVLAVVSRHRTLPELYGGPPRRPQPHRRHHRSRHSEHLRGAHPESLVGGAWLILTSSR
ncbi:MAG: hypothetical protein U0R64_04415 [Candidatus Nanopelagicales bacterium]